MMQRPFFVVIRKDNHLKKCYNISRGNIMEKLYLMFYENQTRVIESSFIHIDHFKENQFVTYAQPFYKLKSNILIGQIDHKKTFGFLRQEVRDVYIDGKDLSDAMHDDIVFVLDGNAPKVIHIIKRALTHFIATFVKKQETFYFKPEVHLNKRLEVTYDQRLVTGHVCKLNVTRIESQVIYATLDQVIGHQNDPDIETMKIVSSYDWPTAFDQELIKEAEKTVLKEDIFDHQRKTLDQDLIITIDGADAKDLDDAISLKKVGQQYHLAVHIADVSFYVTPDSLLDEHAYKRATSVYLADRVIPMLPHILSNDVCSLNPNEPKRTLSCLMVLDQDGKVVSYDIQKTTTISRHRLTYDQVNDFLINHKSLGHKELDDMLITMNELSQKFKRQSKKRGEIYVETKELAFVVDQDGKVLDVYQRKTDQAEALIESFMLIANETVAEHMYHAELPTIYRIHEKPDLDKLKHALEMISILGVPVSFKQLGSPKPLQMITDQTKQTKTGHMIHQQILKAMQKAVYSNRLDIHFGLGARYYTHFTSPIRRYPDLLLHRLIHLFVLGESTHYEKDFRYYEKQMEEFAKHTSNQERKAIQLERDVNKLKSCEFMLNQIGKQFKGMIIQMMSSGMFVQLENGIEGFVHLQTMDDYYQYDPQHLAFIGNRFQYRLGDPVLVELIDVNMMDRKIDFKIIEKRKKQHKKVKTHENHRSKQKGKT